MGLFGKKSEEEKEQTRKEKKEKAEYKKKISRYMNIAGVLVDGVPNIGERRIVKVYLLPEALLIRQESDDKSAELPYTRIKDAQVVTEKEIIEKSKSVVGRAMIGGLFLGGLGATVGAISGVGTKQQVNENQFLVINYSTADSEESKAISIELATVFYEDFIKGLHKMARLDKHEEVLKDKHIEL